jgi:hypothetical protein
MNSILFWDVTPCSAEKFYGRLRGIYCLCLHGLQIGLLCDPENGKGVFLLNASEFLLDYTASPSKLGQPVTPLTCTLEASGSDLSRTPITLIEACFQFI